MPIYKPYSGNTPNEAIGLITRAPNTNNLKSAVDNAILKVLSPTGKTIYPWCGIAGEGSGTPVIYNSWYSGWTGTDFGDSPKHNGRQFIREEFLSNVMEQYVGVWNRTCSGNIYGVTPGRRLFMAVSFTAVDCNPTFGAAFYRYGDYYADNGYGTLVVKGEYYYSGQGAVYIPTISTGEVGLASGYINIPGYPDNNETFWGPVLLLDDLSGRVYIHKLIGTMI